MRQVLFFLAHVHCQILLDLHYVRYSDSLQAGRSGNRIPVGDEISAPLRTHTMGTGYIPEVRWPDRGVDHPPHLAPRLRKE